MKKIFLAAGMVLMAATVTFANSNIDSGGRKLARQERKADRKAARQERRAENRIEVSNATRNQFAMDFPDAKNVQFEKTKDFEEATFVSGSKELTAYYDYDEELVGTTQTKVFTDLPENAQNKILKDYSDYTISRVIEYDDNGDNENNMILYGYSIDANKYFVELAKAGKQIVVQVDLSGNVSFFSDLK